MNSKIENLDRSKVTNAVQEIYREVASNPEKGFHFPVGRISCMNLGYPAEELDALPVSAVESFAGAGYPFVADSIKSGDTVVDVGSGSGTDVLIARHKTGDKGLVYGIDFSETMNKKARENIDKSGLDGIQIRESPADNIPLEDANADVATSNGAINLVTDKDKAYGEIYRILRPGGRIQIADIVLSKPVDAASKANARLWAECIAGAEPVNTYLDLVRAAGFKDVTVIDRLDYFDRSSNESTRKTAKSLGAHAIVLIGRKD
ncbi:methyltransferase domain-containing protein [Pricia sp. S334]|uniref:Arsenite methyltransferase n=1 Tax=Pricia mediterranea TaxID=3076079 RepID=A0ABU3L9K6_9FLAO|nr:methyltransferase domain-containing protein [Pricia sp. S334]MDT7830426.1 methyltransferase domain-containing protein [Pricia sp. S334]